MSQSAISVEKFTFYIPKFYTMTMLSARRRFRCLPTNHSEKYKHAKKNKSLAQDYMDLTYTLLTLWLSPLTILSYKHLHIISIKKSVCP